MDNLRGILIIIQAVGLIGGIIIYLIALTRVKSDDFHFKPWRLKARKEWFRPPGFGLYVSSGIIFLAGCVSGIIYWSFLA